MAHLGKLFPRLFRRDLGFKPETTEFQYLPSRYQFEGNGITPIPGIRFVPGLHVSEMGQWAEPGRTLTYHFNDPGTFTPGVYLRFDYELTDSEVFWRGKITAGFSGVDKVYLEVWSSERPLNLISGVGRVHYIMPFTGPDTAWTIALKPCTWPNTPAEAP